MSNALTNVTLQQLRKCEHNEHHFLTDTLENPGNARALTSMTSRPIAKFSPRCMPHEHAARSLERKLAEDEEILGKGDTGDARKEETLSKKEGPLTNRKWGDSSNEALRCDSHVTS